MPTALVLGASRGIGLEFTRQYLAGGWQVYATHRTEADRLRLRDLGAHTLRLDLLDTADIANLAWQLDGEALDVVVFNAGVYGPRNSSTRTPPDPAQFDLAMRSNVLAPMQLLPVVMPLLAATHGTAAFVSTRMASLALTRQSWGALYRVSKVAGNMVARLAHADWSAQGVRVLALHPGWVRTDMGGPNAEVDALESVAGMRAVIAEPRRCPAGGFYDYRGQVLEW